MTGEIMKYIIENGTPVEAQHGDDATHVLVPIEDWYRVCGDSVELHRDKHIEEVAVQVYSPNPAIQFEEFWQRYPRKVGKKNAATAWSKLSPDQRQRSIDTIDDHTRMWILEGRGTRTIPHASTWLNGWRFDDEIQYAAERDISPPPNNRATRSASVLDKMEGGQ